MVDSASKATRVSRAGETVEVPSLDAASGPISKNPASLKSRIFQAGIWVVTGHFLAFGLRLLSVLIMTRLLAPEAFGIMAIALVVQLIVSLFADIGLQQAVIQSPSGADRSFLNTAWTLQVLRGWLIWSACVVVAVGLHTANDWGWLPPHSAYASPILPFVIAATSFGSAIQGFRSMKSVTVNRDLDLKRVTAIELIAQTISFLITVLLGWITYSVWSFVIGALAASASSTLLSHIWLRGPSDRLEWNRPAVQELMHFGKWFFASSALSVFIVNADRLLLAGWVSAAVLGNYSIAANMIGALEAGGVRLFYNVLMPAFSDVVRREPDRLPAAFVRARWITDAAFVGSAGFLFAAGQWIVTLLFDARYGSAGWMLQWLSFSLLLSRYNVASVAYLALGRPRYLAPITAVKAISLFALVPGLFYAFGLQGAIVGIALHTMPTLPWMMWFNRAHGLNDARLELAVLIMWPLGWLAGSAVVAGINP